MNHLTTSQTQANSKVAYSFSPLALEMSYNETKNAPTVGFVPSKTLKKATPATKLTFMRKVKNELGVSLVESLVAMAVTFGAGAAVTPPIVDTLNGVEADAQTIALEQIQRLQIQAELSDDDVVMSAEDFTELTSDLTETCNAGD